jgi:hypothetical protein
MQESNLTHKVIYLLGVLLDLILFTPDPLVKIPYPIALLSFNSRDVRLVLINFAFSLLNLSTSFVRLSCVGHYALLGSSLRQEGNEGNAFQ